MQYVSLPIVNLKNVGPCLIRASYSPCLNGRRVSLVFVGEVEVKWHILHMFSQVFL